MLQRYISKELIHFVGRRKLSEKEQYLLLIEILKSGQLVPREHFGHPYTAMNVRRGQISQNEIYNPQVAG